MQLVRITNIEHEKYNKNKGIKLTYLDNGKTKKNVIFESSPMYSAACLLTVGDELEINVERTEDGKFFNITYLGPILNQSETMVDEKLPPVVGSISGSTLVTGSYSSSQDRQRISIERQTSLKAAVELIIGCGIKYKTKDDAYIDVLNCAEGFYDYIAERIPVCKESIKE